MQVLARHLAPEDFRVEAIRGLQSLGDPVWRAHAQKHHCSRDYLRLGAWVCGEPAWDPV